MEGMVYNCYRTNLTAMIVILIKCYALFVIYPFVEVVLKPLVDSITINASLANGATTHYLVVFSRK